jgi:aminoglycoside phosphotransferase (APT) family kinase protein
MTTNSGQSEHSEIAASLTAMGLLTPGESFAVTSLSGGVSCDVWRVDAAGHKPVVVKRALPRLRVAAEWLAPVERAASEVAWIKLVAGIHPHWVPKVLAEDHDRNLFVMEYLPPENHPVWKAELAAGRIDVPFAGKVGDALAQIHAATAGKPDIAKAFDNGALFHALRLEPYLLFTAEKHQGLASAIRAEAARIAASRIAVMQGDISPKNILCGPDGPVFIDAETAAIGDPVFDLAFCLNHLLLKSVWHPEWTEDYARSFIALKDAYLAGVTWERASDVEARTARLLPMLFLARVDGKSPAEYLTEESDRAFVRAAAIQMIIEPPMNLGLLAEAYFSIAASRA